MQHVGKGLAVCGIWIGSAWAANICQCPQIFIGSTVATVFIAFSWGN